MMGVLFPVLGKFGRLGRNRAHLFHSAAAVLFVVGAASGPAFAQTASNEASASAPEDIIVTARKRDETSIAVPVTITAISAADIERRNIATIDDVARLVPSLIVGEGVTVQGGNISLRGVSGLDSNTFADQAVSFNIDGVQIAKATVRRLAQMDIQQIEVLKGPQPLFFGKNSPAGVISIRTADPTDHFQAKLSTGYEFRGQEWVGDGYVSGPLTDTLGLRVAAYGSDLRGWAKSTVPNNDFFAPRHRWGPNHKEYAVRGTLKFEPSDTFNARLKLSYGRITGAPFTANYQIINCPLGVPQNGAIDNCRGDDRNLDGDFPASYSTTDSRYGDGETFARQWQLLGGLEMNYNLSDNLTLTSVTGLYKFSLAGVGKIVFLSSINEFGLREFTEELRLTSSYDGPLNFTIGGHFQDSHADAATTIFRIAPTNISSQLSDTYIVQDGRAWSLFGQLRWDITPELELAGGGRYSHEKKVLPVVRYVGASAVRVNPLPDVVTPDTRGSWKDFSPEVTLSYRPSQRLTLFGSYKQGFLSGGFNGGSANPITTSLIYRPQNIKGFEGGVKASLFDDQVRANLSVYTYKVTDLQNQVSVGILQVISNVGRISSRGVDLDLSYSPAAIEGLRLHGAVAYNRARYEDFLANCYTGQTPAQGCVPTLVNGQSMLRQDLAGTEVVRAPEWTGNVGFTFDTPISEGLKIGFSGDVQYSDSYIAHSGSKAQGASPAYTLIDASVRVADRSDRWEIALIGKNLTDRFYWFRSSDLSGSGSGTGTAAGIPADTVASVSRGRQVMLRLTVKLGD
jgi:iron complex outermembrane receptor protein